MAGQNNRPPNIVIFLPDDLGVGDVGYKTGLFGKWHLGDKGPYRPTQRGFDEVLTFEGPAMYADQYYDPILLHNDKPEKWPGYCETAPERFTP